tara:strand:- start:3227 stop:3706 length:480 start_codon:yes stop_codon:yes gene_type:complete
MRNIYKPLIFFSVFLLCSCGYTPLYKSQKVNFNITEIQTNNKNNYYYLFKNSLKTYIQDNQSNLIEIVLKVNLSKNKRIISKDAKGNPLVFSLEIISDLQIFEDNELIADKKIIKKFKYNNRSNIFDLNRYEENIEKNLIKSISEDVIFLISKNTVEKQ